MSGKGPALTRSSAERIKDFREVVYTYNLQQAVSEASRCLLCYDASCRKSCPANVDIPTFIGRIKTKDLIGAIDAIREETAFPSICGRVCPVEELCEKNCVMKQMTEVIAIGDLQRFVADYGIQKRIKPERMKPAKRKVAIVGTGPASLTAAAELTKMGYNVEVFERRHLPGGLVGYGIPAYRLPREVSVAEIEYIQEMGVKINLNMPVKRVSELLGKGFAAVFIGAGMIKCVSLSVPGVDLEGVYSGLDFLERIVNGECPSVSGMRVGVIGGGDVAIDVARSAIRLGAKTVQIIYRRSFEEMPAHRVQVLAAKEEGVEIVFSSAPTKILGDAGRVTGCECIRMKPAERDATGRRKAIPIPGTEFKLDMDILIVAIGQRVDDDFIRHNPDIKFSEGLIEVNEQTGMTSQQGIFAGGDIVNGGATVIQAVAEGKRAAKGIDHYLSGK